jgi:hypothetical protein
MYSLSLLNAVSYCAACYGIAMSMELHIEINKQFGMVGTWASSMYSLSSITIRSIVTCSRYLRNVKASLSTPTIRLAVPRGMVLCYVHEITY